MELKDILGSAFGAIVIFLTYLVVRWRFSGKPPTNKPTKPKPKLTEERRKKIREDIKSHSNTNLARHFLRKLFTNRKGRNK